MLRIIFKSSEANSFCNALPYRFWKHFLGMGLIMETLMQICPLLYLHMSNDQSPCCVVYTWSNKTCCLKQDPKKLRIQKLIINPTSKVQGRNCVDQKRHIAALFTWLSLPRSVYLHGVVAIPCPQMSCFGVFTIIWTMRRFEMLGDGETKSCGVRELGTPGKMGNLFCWCDKETT